MTDDYTIQYHPADAPKKRACFTISEEVLNKFRNVTGVFNAKMSPTIESFMIEYINEKIRIR